MATNVANLFFIALERTRGCFMTLEGSVAEYLFHMQNRKPAAFHIFTSILVYKRKIIQEYSV